LSFGRSGLRFRRGRFRVFELLFEGLDAGVVTVFQFLDLFTDLFQLLAGLCPHDGR